MASRLFLDAFRRSPSAFNVLEGSLLNGKILRVQRSGFLSVDVGFRSPQTIPVTELGQKQISTGDTHSFFLENLETPLGDMELDAKRMDIEHNEDSVWNEVMQAYLKNTLVKGRVLNAVNAGYAVGIGGIVAFLPSSRVYGEIRLGHLHDFKILSTIRELNNVVVTCVEKGDLDAILRSRARLVGSVAASELLLQNSASRSVPRSAAAGERKPQKNVDTGALLARVQAMRQRREAMDGTAAGPSASAGGEAAAGARASSPARRILVREPRAAEDRAKGKAAAAAPSRAAAGGKGGQRVGAPPAADEGSSSGAAGVPPAAGR